MKRISFKLSIAFAACLGYIFPTQAVAQIDTQLLGVIAQNSQITAKNAEIANQFLAILSDVLTAPMKSPPFFSGLFTELTNAVLAVSYNRLALERELDRVLLGNPPSSNSTDVLYSSLFGLDRSFAYDYIRNAAGTNLRHIPLNSAVGPPSAQADYRDYINTVTAVQSFNGYVLSDQYLDQGKQSEIQLRLAAAASSSEWLQHVATEPSADVQRQLLLFQSQSFVLQTQLAQQQRDLLTAQAMNNTLIILTNRELEKLLLARAQGQSR